MGSATTAAAKRIAGVPRVDDRRVIGGIVHALQAGGRWKEASGAYRHKRCPDQGVWQMVFAALVAAGGYRLRS